MFRGFYTLTSSMITQERRLNVISNNMANMATPGFKRDALMTTTFHDALAYRTGSVDKTDPTFLGYSVHKMRVIDERVTDFTQGALEDTGRPLDVAIIGEGFFELVTPAGETVYTRNGSFGIDDYGYLMLQHIGRVIGYDGEPINLGTDKIEFRSNGYIVHEDGTVMGRLRIANFLDLTLLENTGEGMFADTGDDNVIEMMFPVLRGQSIERSNVVAMDEMVAMIVNQRNLQAAGTVVQMHDQLMQRAVNDIGSVV